MLDLKQQDQGAKLPIEIIGIICSFADFETHTAIRSTCSAVRAYIPRPKVVGFEPLKDLVTCYISDGGGYL